MSNKLTGREAVMAVLDGKKIHRRHESGEVWFVSLGNTISSFPSIQQVIMHDDWEIVKEPVVWEGEQVINMKATNFAGAIIPLHFLHKRVKVRIEEIGE